MYYPASLLAAINKLWAHQADLLNPRTRLSLIAAEFSRRNYYGRVYAKAQNVRPFYVKAFDSALSDVDVLVMPTCIADRSPLRGTGDPPRGLGGQLELLGS